MNAGKVFLAAAMLILVVLAAAAGLGVFGGKALGSPLRGLLSDATPAVQAQ